MIILITLISRGGGDRKSEEYRENQKGQSDPFDSEFQNTAEKIAEEHGISEKKREARVVATPVSWKDSERQFFQSDSIGLSSLRIPSRSDHEANMTARENATRTRISRAKRVLLCLLSIRPVVPRCAIASLCLVRPNRRGIRPAGPSPPPPYKKDVEGGTGHPEIE